MFQTQCPYCMLISTVPSPHIPKAQLDLATPVPPLLLLVLREGSGLADLHGGLPVGAALPAVAASWRRSDCRLGLHRRVPPAVVLVISPLVVLLPVMSSLIRSPSIVVASILISRLLALRRPVAVGPRLYNQPRPTDSHPVSTNKPDNCPHIGLLVPLLSGFIMFQVHLLKVARVL